MFFKNTFGISAFLGYDSLLESSLDKGFSYKGYSAVSSGLGLTGRTWLKTGNSQKNTLYLGTSAGMKGSFARYEDLPHYFFYLSVVTEIFLDFVPFQGERWFIRTGMPVVFRFRKDTDLSVSAGLSLHLFHEPAMRAGRVKKGEKE